MHDQNPKISVLTVALNAADTILSCIDSVNLQDYANIEHILFDGRSDDNTLNIMQNKSTRLNTVHSCNDSGLYDALNRGISLCSGDFIVVLHADDKFHSNSVVSEAVKFIVGNNFPDVVSGSVLHVTYLNVLDNAYLYSSKYFKINKLRFGFLPAHNATFVKRHIYTKYAYNSEFISAGDYEWFLRVFNDKQIKYLAIPLIVSQQRLGGLSTMGLKSIIRTTKEMNYAIQLNSIGSNFLLLLSRLPIKYIQRKLKWRGNSW
tara:strand:- start:8805 stop:9587 length:783 start_codon:yes stop_codon:yes gene_type:complete